MMIQIGKKSVMKKKKRIGYTDDEDGIFFIEYKEMLHYFDGV